MVIFFTLSVGFAASSPKGRAKYRTPVSYTHLDVYKRQAYDRKDIITLAKLPLFNADGSVRD